MRISYLIKKTATFKMLFLCLTLLLSVVFTNQSFAQLTGTKTVPGTYATLALAVADLNAQGVGAGGVTFDIAAGYTETLTATLSITATGTLANPIVFQKSGAGANPLITAYTGGTATPASLTALDGIIRLVGSDWVTIDGISLQENAANTSGGAFMEYGLAFYKVSGTDGCNNNTIKNCVITLNRNNIATGTTETEIGSTGIFAGNATFNNPSVALTVTAASGTNSNNKFYSDTIQNCNVGISMRGFTDILAPFAFYDQNNDIGGASTLTGNYIIDFGGGIGAASSNTVNGIKSVNANAVNISYNIIRSSTGVLAPTANENGIFTSSPNAALTTINNNTVTVQIGTNSNFLVTLGIDCSNGSVVSAGVVNMNNNTITNCNIAAGTNLGNNGPFTGMRIQNAPALVNMNNNLIYGDTMFNVGTHTGILYAGTNLSAVVSISNNQIYNIHKVNTNPAVAGGGNNLIGISSNYAFVTNINNNIIRDFTIINIVNTMNCKASGIFIGTQGTGTSMSITNNQVYNLFTTGTSTATTQTVTNGIECNGNTGVGSANLTISGNTFYNFNSTNTAVTGAGALLRGMEVSTALNINVFNNKMYDFTCTGIASAIVGYRVLAGLNLNIYNNYIGRFFTPTANGTATIGAAEQIIGISDESTASQAGQNHNFYYNTIYLSGTSSGANFGSTAMKTNVNPNTILRNNIFINNTTNTGGGIAAAHRRTSTSLTTYMSASNNNIFYATTPLSVARNIYYDGTNSDITLAAYKARVTGRDNASASELTPFLNTATGASANFLHVDPTVATAAESGGSNIGGITNDYDADIRQGNVGYLGTGTAPDIGADEFGGIVNDVTPPAIAAGTVLGACGTGDRTISGVIITDATGVPTTGGLVPRIYYRKSGTIPYFSQPGTLNSGSGSNGSWSFTIVAADMGGLATGNTVEYYFIAQDVVGIPNISSVPFGAVATDVNTVTTAPTTISSYTILNSLSGTYTVGVGGNYATITAAVAAYNTSCLSGPVVFALTDASYISETFPITINSNPFASATNTLTIQPVTSVANPSGNVTIQSSGTTHTFALFAADYVTIQGSVSPVTNSVCPLVRSTRNLTIQNNNSASSQNCVIFIASNNTLFDGATNNKIVNCNIVGGATTLPWAFTNTGIGFGAGPVATGFSTGTGSLGYNNSNNTVENNAISKVAYGIISQGFSFAIKNQNNTYNLNEMSGTGINGIFRFGIFLGFENNVSITGNTFKNMIGQSTGTDVIAINLGNNNGVAMNSFGTNEVTNAIVTKNVIDNIQTFATIGSQSAVGIATSSSPSGFITSGTNLISNNMISGVSANGNGANDVTCGIMIGNQVGITNQVYDNTVNINADGFSTNANNNLALFVGGGSGVIPVMDIKNNILVNTTRFGTGNNFVMALQIPGTAGNYANLQSDNNDFFVSNGGGFYNAIGVIGTGATPSINPGTSNFVTLAAWQAQTGRDANSKSVLPSFVSTTNPHLVNTAAANFNLNGTGVTLAAVTDDIDCEPRTGASSPDIGADEFSAPPVDLAFDAIKPTANTTCHSANEPIIVTVRNTGSTTINMAVDTIFVSTTYSGTISGTSIDTVYAGTLAPNATVDVTLEPTINTTANGSYTFTTTITPITGEGFTTNNNNVTSITINNTPVAVSTSVFNNNLCLGYSTPITATATLGTLPYTYSWSPATGLNSTNVATVTAAPGATETYTVTVTDACGNTATATALVNISIPGITSVSGNSRCGVGPVTLSGVPNAGSSLNWYTTPTGTTIAQANSNTYTPSITGTTTYYVSATTGNVPYYVGLTDLSPLNGAVTFGAGAGRGQMITANKPGAITGCIVYPSNAATITAAMVGGFTRPIQICLRLRGQTANIATAGPFSFTLAQLATPVQLNFNLPITTPGDYQLVYDTIGGLYLQNTVGLAQYSFSYTGTYPLSTADGSLVMPGGAFSSTNATVQATTYNAFWNVQYTTYCESARQPVVATLLTAPALTISPNRNICISDTIAISVTSNIPDYDNYVWTASNTNSTFYSDPLCTAVYLPGSSATTIYYIGTIASTTTFTCNASNALSCSNVATSTVITQPALTSLITNTYGICGSGSAILSITPTTGFGAGAILWESSTDSSNWSLVGGSTVSLTTPVLTQKTYFRVSIRNSNNAICSQLGLDAINVYNPSIISAPGVTRCGVGSVNLVANVSAGATAQWYTTPTSQPALLTGNSVTSPVIAASTTYYVSASEGSSTYGIGVPEASSTYGSVFVFSGVSGPVTPDKPLWITVVKPGVLEKLTVYPIAAGTMTINLRLRGSAADIIVVGPFTITAAQIGTAVELPVYIPLNTPGLYQITNIGIGCAVMSPYNGAAGAYPFSTADGSLLINGSANNSTSVSAPTSGYNAMFNLKYTTACESARVPVLVTVTPPPTFTTNVTIDTVCGQTPKMLAVSSPAVNYDSIVWAPATGLFTDASGFIPYIAGTNEDTVYANPAVTTDYIATAYDNVGGCVDTNKISIAPIYILPSIATNANLTEVCGTGSVLVNVTGIYNSNLATYQWESSTDNTNWSPVIGGTGTSLLTPVLTQNTYFHCVIYCTGSIIGDSPALLINVNNPLIISTVADTVCGSGTPTLQATASPVSATINWYDAPTGGYLIGSGNSFTTPVITATTNYYAEASTGNYTEPVGLPTPNPSGGVNLFPGRGLRFSATKQLTINSVTIQNIDNSGSGFIDIALQDNTGNEITSTGIVGSLTPGVHVIPLNFVVPVGTDYRLVVKNGGGGTFYSSINPVTYPMNSFSGAMSITAGLSQTGVSTSSQYYFFFGITITAACYSPRVAVEAFVKTTPAVTVTASATSVCAGSSVSLSASSAYDPNYSYFWLPDGLSGSNVSVSPTASTIYTLVATDISGGPNNGCQAIKTVAISIIPAIPPFTVSPNNYPLCLGSSVNINVNLPALGGSAVIGTSTLNANGPTNYPAPYGELYETAKHQILILASELTAQGMTAGSEINSLAFNVQSVGAAGIMNGYRIQMASTNVNSLTNWITSGLTPVFGPVNYQPVAGSNVHTLSSSFVWDGTSNIVVQTCFSNDPSGSTNAGTANAVMNRTTTVFNSVLYTNFNDLDVCPLTPSFVTSDQRPNMVLGYDKTVSYSWAPATGLNNSTSASVLASPSVSTIYTVTVTNTLFGCTATSTSQIDVAQVLKPYLNVGDSTLCSNDLGFDMIVQDSGFYSGGYPAGTTISFYGAGAILYQQGPSNIFFNQNNSDAFYAVVTLPTFLGGCTSGTDTAVIDFGTAQAPQYILSTDSVKCFGSSTGNAIVDITFGGTPNFRYQWYDSGMNNLLRDVTKTGTNDSLNNVPAGMYIVVITDHQGATVTPYCSVIDSVYVGEPVAPVAVSENMVSHVDLICNGATNGTLGIDVTGGTPDYSYNWSNGSTVEDLTGIEAGTYTVIVSDSRGCTATLSITLTQPSAMILNCNATPVSCNGGSNGTASVTASGATPGYTYLWSTAAVTTTISGLAAGTYTVTVTDANGCSTTCTSVVTEPAVVTANCSATPASCNGGSNGTASVTAGGGTPGYTYLWSTTATTSSINGLAAGIYAVTVTDANGCSVSCTSEVTEPTAVTANCNATPASCNGGLNGTASVTAGGGTPGYTYLWSTTATTSSINGLAAGIYTVTVTDANGCSTTCTSEVTEPAILSVAENQSNHTDIVCFGEATGSLGVDVSGGTSPYSYVWSNGYTVGSIQTGLVVGTYTVTVTDVNGCSSFITMTLTTNPLVTPTITGNVFTCGGATTLSTQVYASYLWSNGATTQSIIVNALGTYTVTVTNGFGCTGTATKVVTSSINTPAKPSTMTGSFIGNCVKLNMTYTCSTVPGALTYNWTVPVGVKIISGQGSNSIVVNYTPAYTGTSGIISVSAVNLCGSSPALKRYTSSRLTSPVIAGSNTMCPGDIKTYTVAPVAGALSYTWTKVAGSTILSGQGTTTVTIKWGAVGGVIKCTANNACGGSIAANFGVSLTCAKVQSDKFDFSKLSLYPNPASTSATLQFDGFDNGKGLLQVFDIVGQLVITQDLKVTLGQNQYQLDLATLPKGIYSIRVVYNGMIRNEKLIIQ